MEKITISTLEDAKPYVGRRVRLFWNRGEHIEPRGVGVLTNVKDVPGRSGRLVIGVSAGSGLDGVGRGGIDAVYFGTHGDCALIELLDQTRAEQLAQKLDATRAEVARLEAEIAREEAAAQKAREEREAEDARYPLPQGYRWIEADCVEDSDGFSIEIDHAETDRHISGTLAPDGTPILSIEDPDDHGVMISARLDVVRALIARYDAQHGANDAKPEPYTIDIRGKWASDVSHTFQDGDVIDLTFCSGRVERATIDRVDSDGDIWIRGGYLGDCGDHSRIAGYVDGRGVIKVTLVSRGAQ